MPKKKVSKVMEFFRISIWKVVTTILLFTLSKALSFLYSYCHSVGVVAGEATIEYNCGTTIGNILLIDEVLNFHTYIFSSIFDLMNVVYSIH